MSRGCGIILFILFMYSVVILYFGWSQYGRNATFEFGRLIGVTEDTVIRWELRGRKPVQNRRIS